MAGIVGKMVNFGPQTPKKYPPNLKNGHRGAKFPFSECQNYTDKSISQIPPGPPNRGSKPPWGGGHPHPPLHPLLPEKPANLGGDKRGGGVKIDNFGVEGGWGGDWRIDVKVRKVPSRKDKDVYIL